MHCNKFYIVQQKTSIRCIRCQQKKSVLQDHCSASLGQSIDAKQWLSRWIFLSISYNLCYLTQEQRLSNVVSAFVLGDVTCLHYQVTLVLQMIAKTMSVYAMQDINPFAPRKAKIVYNFGLSECIGLVKHSKLRLFSKLETSQTPKLCMLAVLVIKLCKSNSVKEEI